MPSVSEVQRGYLAEHFGKAWMKKHGYDNPGPLPHRVGDKDPVQQAKPMPKTRKKKRKHGKKGEDGKHHPKHHFTMHNTKHY